MNINEFCNVDLTFNEGVFLTKVNNIFVKLLTAIMLDELDNVKHFLSDNVYNYAKNIIDTNNANGFRQMYDELNVKDSKITSIEVNENVYSIKVYLQSRYMDYIIKLDDGNHVSGNNTSRIQVDYELLFTKNINSMKQGIVKKCPTCMASLDVNNSGKCQYCGSTYDQENYDWVLTKLSVLN